MPEVSAWLHSASRDPAQALAAGFVALDRDAPWRQACAQWSNDRPAHEALVIAIVDWIDDSSPRPTLARNQAFAFVSACASLLQRRNRVPAVIRTKLHDGTRYYLVPRRTGWHPPFAHQPDKLQAWLGNWWVVPERHSGFTITALDVRSERTTRVLADCVATGTCRVMVASFADPTNPELLTSSTHFHFQRLRDPDRRWGQAIEVLEAADRGGAHILVLPELTMPASLRGAVVQWLAQRQSATLCLVVPGSFHDQVDGERRNRTQLMVAGGDVRSHHDKVCALPHPIGTGTLLEAIATGDHVRLVNTPLGLIATPICRDFLDQDSAVADFWQAIGPGLALVPSMSNASGMRAHATRAQSLATTHQTLVAVANEAPPVPQVEAPPCALAVCARAKVQVRDAATALRIETFDLDLASKL